jgi:hypothetical protein
MNNTELVYIVSEILNLPVSEEWRVEKLNDLALVSMKNGATPEFASKRGSIVDLTKKKVIVPCYQEIPVIVSYEYTGGPLVDSNNVEHVFDQTTKFRYSFEGTVIRMFYHDGKCYYATNRKLDCSKSKWGSKKSFYQMFEELGGKNIKLFDDTKKYSPYSHFFVVVHPDLLITTKQDVGNGYLVYLGSYSTYTNETSPYNEDEVDFVVRTPTTTNSFEEAKLKASVNEYLCYEPKDLTQDEVNYHLQNGYTEKSSTRCSNDLRTGSGECVMACQFNNDNLPPKLYRIASPSYNFRTMIRGDDANILHRMYSLMNDALLDNTLYFLKYPWLTYEDSSYTMEKCGSITHWNTSTVNSFSFQIGREQKLLNIWKCLLLSTPLSKQKQVFTFYSHVCTTRKEVAQWLVSLYGKELEEGQELIPRAKKLLELAVKYANEHNVKVLNSYILLKNMKFLISNEHGESLYKLSKNRKEFLGL